MTTALTTYSSANKQTTAFILCDDNNGVVTKFIRHFIYNTAGIGIDNVIDSDLTGSTTYTPTGIVLPCCEEPLVGEGCYRKNFDPSVAPWVIDSLTTAHKDIPGYGTITMTRLSGDHEVADPAISPCRGGNQDNAIGIIGGTASSYRFTLPQIAFPFLVDVIDLDSFETFISSSHGDADFLPADITQPGGAGTIYRPTAGVDNGIYTFQWSEGPATYFDAAFTGACLQFDFDKLVSPILYDYLLKRSCTGDLIYIDKLSGEELDFDQITLAECKCCTDDVTVETYRISGNVAGVSTPGTGPTSIPVVGNTVTIPAGFRSLSWQWLRETEQDPGTGAVARLDVNGFGYFAGSGPQYQTANQVIQGGAGLLVNTEYQFTAVGLAHVEIVVIR